MTITIKYVTYPEKQLQRKFKHACDFGLFGVCNTQSISEWKKALEAHLLSTDIIEVRGTFRGKTVVYYFDPTTKLNVMCSETNIFVSGWKLSPAQVEALVETGKLGGGG